MDSTCLQRLIYRLAIKADYLVAIQKINERAIDRVKHVNSLAVTKLCAFTVKIKCEIFAVKGRKLRSAYTSDRKSVV